VVEASLTTKTLNRLRESRRVALDNLKFYECLYYDMEDSPDRTSIGQAMAQKQSYIGAVDAILKNHDISVLDTPLNPPANDCTDILSGVEMGDHLAQEERYLTGEFQLLKVQVAAIKITHLGHFISLKDLNAHGRCCD